MTDAVIENEAVQPDAEQEDLASDVWGDLTPDEALLSGVEAEGEAVEPEPEPEPQVAASEPDHSESEPARPVNIVPTARVAKVLDQIREYSERAGIAAPDFGDAVEMPASEFSELTATRDRMRIRAAAAAVELEDPAPRQPAPVATNEPVAQADPEFDFDANAKAIFDATMEGDVDRVMALQRERDALKDQQIRKLMQSERDAIRRELNEERQREVEHQTYKSSLSQLVESHPVLAENNFQNPAANDIAEWMGLYLNQGKSRIEALRMAAERVLPVYSAPTRQATAQPAAAPRKQTAIERNVAAAKAQAPKLDTGIGNRTVPLAPDIAHMDPEAWERLPQSERNQLLM
jgi:hypothetical protein